MAMEITDTPPNKFAAPTISPSEPLNWIAHGWRDFTENPMTSLLAGFIVFVLSAVIVAGLYFWRLDYFLLPALSAFVIAGPLFATGLYLKSKNLQQGQSTTFAQMVFIKPKSGGQVVFVGVLLSLLALLWLRSAVLIYAVFFGLRPFPGGEQIIPMLFTTPTGWFMLATGTLVGALFAAFAFAISVFSIPMLLDRKTDAFTAMGKSMATAWKNKAAMLLWGALVTFFIGIGFATFFVGLIITYPVVAHASWRAYASTFGSE